MEIIFFLSLYFEVFSLFFWKKLIWKLFWFFSLGETVSSVVSSCGRDLMTQRVNNEADHRGDSASGTGSSLLLGYYYILGRAASSDVLKYKTCRYI